MAEVALGAGRRRCWPSCASAAWCIRARSTRSSRTARRATGSAARPTPARSCSTACTTAACCAWRGAKAACACYAARDAHEREPAEADAALDALVDVIVAKYAPLPAATLGLLVMWLGSVAAPQWRERRAAALARAKARLPSATVDGQRLVLAGRREPGVAAPCARRRRCGCSHPSTRSSGTAAASSCCGAGPTASRPTRRQRSACAATTRCRCCGATASSAGATWRSAMAGCDARLGYVAGKPPREAGFRQALDDELARIETFLAPR